jgi:hypothetical protein
MLKQAAIEVIGDPDIQDLGVVGENVNEAIPHATETEAELILRQAQDDGLFFATI